MTVHNIILFGESGSGKSSIVNMIIGEPVAKVSSGLLGCTFEHASYGALIGNIPFHIYDTAGLNEADKGCVPHWKAVHQLYTLIRSLDGVSLLIYCMRGRFKENTLPNWILFNKILCREEVPIIAVLTGLENDEDIAGRAPEMKKIFNKYNMFPKDVGCITSIRGRMNEHSDFYNSSQRWLRSAIKETYRKKPWTTRTDEWIAQIYKTTYTTKLCIFTDTRLEFTLAVGKVVDQCIKEAGMETADSDMLKSTLLLAEKKLSKKKLLKKI